MAEGQNFPSTCRACGKPLLLENLFVCDGCPCNSPNGVNFSPEECSICRTDRCTRPGHRIPQLFGSHLLPCIKPPPGWRCTRGYHADGPCAAVQT